ncbi:UNVERIFIED_CONTAM: hypothetical protein Slati_0808700 [Sesamum latifolium]|uniref:Reverse transcriptase domain-containing protein n=1 Tax=Sesamum latifolium TaxID=2727402 RepID=A0AAW2XSA9_9LAMI
MKRLKEEVLERMAQFRKCEIRQIPRTENSKADELARMGSHLDDIYTRRATILTVQPEGRIQEISVVSQLQSESWMDKIREYLEIGNLPGDKDEARRIKNMSGRFFIEGGYLFKKSFMTPVLRCLNPEEAWEVMREIHEGSCGNHAGGRSLATKILRNRYF